MNIDWDSVAQRLKYANALAMWQDLYGQQSLSISQLAERLGISRNAIRLALIKAGVVRRTRGGAQNNKTVVVTPDLLSEIRRNGVAAVAKRLDVNGTTLYKRLRAAGIDILKLRREEGADASSQTVRVEE